MALSAEHRSKFAALHRQWKRLQMSEKISSGTKNSKETNLQICSGVGLKSITKGQCNMQIHLYSVHQHEIPISHAKTNKPNQRIEIFRRWREWIYLLICITFCDQKIFE